MKKQVYSKLFIGVAALNILGTSCKKEQQVLPVPNQKKMSEMAAPQRDIVYGIEKVWIAPSHSPVVQLLHLDPIGLTLLDNPIVIPNFPEQKGIYKGVCYDLKKDNLICMTRGFDNHVSNPQSQFVYVDKNTAQVISAAINIVLPDGKPFVLGAGDIEYRQRRALDYLPPFMGMGRGMGENGVSMYASVNEQDYSYPISNPGIYEIVWDGTSSTAVAKQIVDFAPLGIAYGNAQQWDGITARSRGFTMDRGNGTFAIVEEDLIYYGYGTKIFKFDEYGHLMNTENVTTLPQAGQVFGFFNRNSTGTPENYVGGGYTASHAIQHITGATPAELWTGSNIHVTYPSSGGEGLSVLDYAAKYIREDGHDDEKWCNPDFVVTLP